MSLCPFNVKMHFFVDKFQILAVLSQDEDTSKLLFNFFIELIVFECPSRVNIHFKSNKSQILTVLSLEPEAIMESSSEIDIMVQIVPS